MIQIHLCFSVVDMKGADLPDYSWMEEWKLEQNKQ